MKLHTRSESTAEHSRAVFIQQSSRNRAFQPGTKYLPSCFLPIPFVSLSRTDLVYHHVVLNVADGRSTELSPKHKKQVRVIYVGVAFIDHPSLRRIHLAPIRWSTTDAFKLLRLKNRFISNQRLSHLPYQMKVSHGENPSRLGSVPVTISFLPRTATERRLVRKTPLTLLEAISTRSPLAKSCGDTRYPTPIPADSALSPTPSPTRG